jgi:hypothetical protein
MRGRHYGVGCGVGRKKLRRERESGAQQSEKKEHGDGSFGHGRIVAENIG